MPSFGTVFVKAAVSTACTLFLFGAAFARQSGEELLFAPQIAAEKVSDGIRGDYAPLEALREILGDTGLTFSITPSGAILVQLEGKALPTAAAGGSPQGISEAGATKIDMPLKDTPQAGHGRARVRLGVPGARSRCLVRRQGRDARQGQRSRRGQAAGIQARMSAVRSRWLLPLLWVLLGATALAAPPSELDVPIINAADRVVAPGFIDLMGQDSVVYLQDPAVAEGRLQGGCCGDS